MRKNKKQILIIFLVACLLLIPMFVCEYKIGDDTMFHIANIDATVQTLDDYLPNDILPILANNYGYATRAFYPVLPHTFVAYLVKITSLNITTALKISHLIVLFLSGVSMYYLSLKLSKNKNLALTSSIIYMAFPYHLGDIYKRDALAECFLFIFLPMIINGLYELFNDKRKFLLLFVGGYVLGMMSHFTMMIYFTLLLIPFFIIYRKKVFTKENIKTLIIAAIFILLIASPQLVNMFQNKFLGSYRVFEKEVMAQGIQHSGLLLDFINYFGFYDAFTYNGSSMHFYLNIVVLLLVFLLYRKREQIDFKNYTFMIWFTGLSILLASIIFPWDILPNFLRMLQFPWRCMVFVALGVSCLVVLVIPKIKFDYRIINILIIFMAMLFDVGFYSKSSVDLENIDYELGMGWQKEYLPVKTYENLDYFENREYKIIGIEESKIISDKMEELVFEVSSNGTVELPRLYYLGYVLRNENNDKVVIYETENGFVGCDVDKGTYTLTYERTIYVKVARCVSLVSIIIFFGYFGLDVKKLYKKRNLRYNNVS